MSQKLITVMLLLFAAISLIYINFSNNWIFIVIALIFSIITLLSASLLLFIRYRKQYQVEYEKI
jgi:hypothetical protein